MKKPKILVVLGPTASGKSDLAVHLARRFNGEVISADSRQVYTGLDLGSGKITRTEMRGVPHHLLDVVSPKKVFTVAQYKALADAAIADIISRGKLPIICGGTGFYIDAVVSGVVLPDVPPNKKLRAQLEKKSAAQLFALLKKNRYATCRYNRRAKPPSSHPGYRNCTRAWFGAKNIYTISVQRTLYRDRC